MTWADSQRQLACGAWLEALKLTHGVLPSSLSVASADASFRRYLRVDTQAGASLIVMDAPPDKENCEPFVKVAKLMKEAGLKAPGGRAKRGRRRWTERTLRTEPH